MGKDFTEAKGLDNSSYKNLLIVDGLNLAFRYKHAGKKQFAAEYINTIKSLANSYDAKHVIVLGDGGSDYRESLYPQYKGNRKELREKQTEEEAEDFRQFLEEFNKTFELLGESFYTFRFKGVEADDIAAYISNHLKDDYETIWLISSDKDWDLLVNEKVSRFSYVTRKEVTISNWDTHYSYKPEEHISIKVLMGDKGDHILGVEGVGIKRAESLIKDYGSAYDVYDAIPINSKYKYIQKLNEFKDTILLNYLLMDLVSYCEDAVGKENINKINKELKGE
jgi:5'-3' exonuclease